MKSKLFLRTKFAYIKFSERQENCNYADLELLGCSKNRAKTTKPFKIHILTKKQHFSVCLIFWLLLNYFLVTQCVLC